MELSPHTRFPGVRHQPLGHLSAFKINLWLILNASAEVDSQRIAKADRLAKVDFTRIAKAD
jgi:hypothetical protein